MKKIVPITSLAELTSITQQLSIPEKLLQPTGILQDTRQRGLHDPIACQKKYLQTNITTLAKKNY